MTVFYQIRNRFLLGISIYCSFAACHLGEGRGQGPDKSPEGLAVVVAPYGFIRSNLSLPAGAYLFVVVNRTGFEDIPVYLERMPGEGLTDTPTREEFGDTVGASRARLVRSVQLAPGTYRIRVANRPTWVCAIHVN